MSNQNSRKNGLEDLQSAFAGAWPSASRCAVTMNPDPDSTREVVVKLENGLHLRPLSQIVQLAQRFSAILFGGDTVDGKSSLDQCSGCNRSVLVSARGACQSYRTPGTEFR